MGKSESKKCGIAGCGKKAKYWKKGTLGAIPVCQKHYDNVPKHQRLGKI